MTFRKIHVHLLTIIIFGIGVVLLFSFGDRFFTLGLSKPFPVESLTFQAGDNPEWKNTDLDDTGWSKKIPSDNRYWWRANIILDTAVYRNGPLGLGIRTMLGASEVYWDGNLIGKNGAVGNSAESEIPGGIDGIFMIPEMLSAPGPHVLAVRVSQFRLTGNRAYPFLKISGYDVQSRTLIIIAAFMHILAGLFLGIAIYYFLVYFKSFRRRPFLVFGAICLFLFFWILLEYVKFYYAYPYHLHYLRLDGISVLVFGVAVLVPLFVMEQFGFKWKGWTIAGLTVFLLIAWYLESDYDKVTLYWITASTVVSICVAARALLKEKPFAKEAMIGLVPLLIAGLFFEPFYYDRLLFLSFTVFIIVNLYVLSRIIGEEREKYEKSIYQTERLKIELLKKNIQPHYLMNTLTALISWVEESPKIAEQFIVALAEEFETLRSVSEKKLIPVSEEIRLCNAHLAVMRFRDELNYCLKTEGIDPEEMIPPAIFLTLVENGLTHNKVTRDNSGFILLFSQNGNTKTYTLTAPGQAISDKKTTSKGTGLKYVEARLRENYGDNWSLHSEQTDVGWVTKIIIE